MFYIGVVGRIRGGWPHNPFLRVCVFVWLRCGRPLMALMAPVMTRQICKPKPHALMYLYWTHKSYMGSTLHGPIYISETACDGSFIIRARAHLLPCTRQLRPPSPGGRAPPKAFIEINDIRICWQRSQLNHPSPARINGHHV